MSARTETPHARHPTHSARPTLLETSEFFEDVPLSPLYDGARSSTTSCGFSHLPLDHEMVASRSVWGGFAASHGLGDRRRISWTVLSGQGFPVAAAGGHSEISPASMDERTSESMVLGVASAAVTLVETPVALGTKAGPALVVDKVRVPTECPRDRDQRPSTSERDTCNEPCGLADQITRSTGPADLTAPMPSASVTARATLARVERPGIPTPGSIPESFDMMAIPVFPFPAGTTRCTNRDCPIKHRHEQGPYLHKGKLRTRSGSVFGSSNPPPEIWFLYDMSRGGGFRGAGDRAFAAVELFVRYHFGETRGEYVGGRSGVRGGVQREAKGGGKVSRFWRVWG